MNEKEKPRMLSTPGIVTEQPFRITFRHWGDRPIAEEEVLEALQDALSPGGRLYFPDDAEIEGIYVTKGRPTYHRTTKVAEQASACGRRPRDR